MIEESRISSVEVKFVDIRKNTDCEGSFLDHYWHWGTKAWVAKRIRYPRSPCRKRCVLDVGNLFFSVAAKALSTPPGEYDRKVKTQMNW